MWYVGFRACQVFYLQYGRFPGTIDTESACLEDAELLSPLFIRMGEHYGVTETDLWKQTVMKRISDYCTELVRYGNAEIHNIASVVGGVASQEAVKIITGQYVPLNNTYVYNGISSVGGVYQF